MQTIFRAGWFALVLSGILLAVMGLMACAVPPTLPVLASPITDAPEMASNKYQARVTLMSPIIAGDNSVTVQLWEATSGKPLHDATVRVTVSENKNYQPAQDNHAANAHEADEHSHSAASVDNHTTLPSASPNVAPTPPSAKHDTHGATTSAPTVEKHVTHGATTGKAPVEAHDTHATETNSAGHADAGHGGNALTARHSQGDYAGQVIFPNAGNWLLAVNYEIDGAVETALFAVQATRSVETWFVLSGFLGVNVAVVALAGVTKRKVLKK